MLSPLDKVIALREQCTVDRDEQRGDFASYYGKLRKQRESEQPSSAPAAPAVRRRPESVTPLERAVQDILDRGKQDPDRASEIAASVERFVAATNAGTNKLEKGSRTDKIDVPDLELEDELDAPDALGDDAALDAAIEAAATAESLADASAADVAIAGSISELLGAGTIGGMGVVAAAATAATAVALAAPAADADDTALDAATDPGDAGASISDLLAASAACGSTTDVLDIVPEEDDDDGELELVALGELVDLGDGGLDLVLGDGLGLGDGGLGALGVGAGDGKLGAAPAATGVSSTAAAGIHAALVAGESTEQIPTMPQATSHLHLVLGEDTERIVVTVAVRGEHVATTVRGANEQLTASLARNAAVLDDALRAKGLALDELDARPDDPDAQRQPRERRDTQQDQEA